VKKLLQPFSNVKS